MYKAFNYMLQIRVHSSSTDTIPGVLFYAHPFSSLIFQSAALASRLRLISIRFFSADDARHGFEYQRDEAPSMTTNREL